MLRLLPLIIPPQTTDKTGSSEANFIAYLYALISMLYLSFSAPYGVALALAEDELESAADPVAVTPPPTEEEIEAHFRALGAAHEVCLQDCQVAADAASAGTSSSDSPCTRAENHISLYCPNTGKTVINPYAVLSDTTRITHEACRNYLLYRAHQSTTQATQNYDFTTAEKQTLSTGANLFLLTSHCRGEISHGSDLANILATHSNAVNTVEFAAAESRDYCRLAGQPCVMMGGRMRTIQGRQYCVAQGVLLDQTCLGMSADKLYKLKWGLQNARHQGPSCLRDQAGAPSLAQDLSRQFSNTAPTTQVCCRGPCSATAPFHQATGGGSASSGVMARATNRSANPANGTLYVFDEALNSPQRTLNGTLFHEMLHRAGQCMNPLHNARFSDIIDEEHTPPFCTSGYVALSPPQIYSQLFGIPTPDYATYVTNVNNAYLTHYKSEMLHLQEGQSACVMENPCRSGTAISSLQLGMRYMIDPVYACETLCFDHKPAAIRNHVRNLCRQSEGVSRSSSPNADNFCPGTP